LTVNLFPFFFTKGGIKWEKIRRNDIPNQKHSLLYLSTMACQKFSEISSYKYEGVKGSKTQKNVLSYMSVRNVVIKK